MPARPYREPPKLWLDRWFGINLWRHPFGADNHQTGLSDSNNVLRNILRHAVLHLGASTLVVEPYVSTDWRDEYQAWYSRLFRDVPRFTARIHCFATPGLSGKPLARNDLFNLERLITDQKAEYLGYSVVRPFQVGRMMSVTVGETILSPVGQKNRRKKKGADADQLEKAISLCKSRFKTNIYGSELTVEGFPFIQQDQAVSVCADANLWMVARYLHSIGQARRFRPSEMESLARQTYAAGTTRMGLEKHQLYGAMDRMSLNPDYIVPSDGLDALRTICAYVLSKQPLIAMVGEKKPNHVVTIIGCRFGNDRISLPSEPTENGTSEPHGGSERPQFFEEHCTSLIVHNDAKGPYLVVPPKVKYELQDSTERLFIEEHPVYGFFVPIPHRVHLRAEDVTKQSLSWLRELVPVLHYWRDTPRSDLMLRPFLCEGSWVKKKATRLALDSGNPTSWGLEHYWRQKLPKHVWLVELVKVQPKLFDALGSYRIVGELILDSTSHPENPFDTLISLRLGPTMIYRTEGLKGASLAMSQELKAFPWFSESLGRRKFRGVEGLLSTPYSAWTEGL